MHIAFMLLALLALIITCGALIKRCRANPLVAAINIAEGTHAGHLTKFAGAPIAQRHLLCKFGADANHVVVAGVNDAPIGVLTDEAEAAGDPINIALLGSASETRLMRTSEDINAGDFLVPAADGLVRKLPAAAGTYTVIGRALAGAKAGDVFEADPIPCSKQTVA